MGIVPRASSCLVLKNDYESPRDRINFKVRFKWVYG